MHMSSNKIASAIADPTQFKVIRFRSKIKLHTRGYTLLELLISLALSVLVVGAIGTAIQLYLVSLAKIQTDIERKQLARGLIQMISNDLRAGVQYKAADYADLENLVQTQKLAINNDLGQLLELESIADGGGSLEDFIENSVTESADNSSENSEEVDAESDLVIEEEAAAFRPSLFGTADSVTVDISRLPRLDQYNAIIAGDASELQTPSDVKKLAYFVSGASPIGNRDQIAFSRVASGGLYRRQIDRAVAAHSGDPNLVTSPDEHCDLVASEVAEIRFRYFDGEGWQSEWNSEEKQGFPLAIEFILVFDPARSTDGQNYQYRNDESTLELSRSVIHLPAAELPPEEQE